MGVSWKFGRLGWLWEARVPITSHEGWSPSYTDVYLHNTMERALYD